MQLDRAGDRHDPEFLREQPGYRHPRSGRLLFTDNLDERIDHRLVRRARRRRKARNRIAEVVAAERRVLVDGAGQEAFA